MQDRVGSVCDGESRESRLYRWGKIGDGRIEQSITLRDQRSRLKMITNQSFTLERISYMLSIPKFVRYLEGD